MNHKNRASLFGALSDPLRLKLIDLLLKQGEACGKELSDYLDASVALVSHHVKVLEKAKMLKRRRDGRYYLFSLNRKTLNEAIDPEDFKERPFTRTPMPLNQKPAKKAAGKKAPAKKAVKKAPAKKAPAKKAAKKASTKKPVKKTAAKK